MTANEVKQIRESLGISQEILAEKVGVHTRTIQNWESGGKIPKSKDAILRSLIPTQHVVFGGQHVQNGDAVNGDKIVERIGEENQQVDAKVAVFERVECDIDKIKAELAELTKTHAEVVAQNSRLLAIIENLTKNLAQ